MRVSLLRFSKTGAGHPELPQRTKPVTRLIELTNFFGIHSI